MKCSRSLFVAAFVFVAALAFVLLAETRASSAPNAPSKIYLPLVQVNPAPATLPVARRVNAPYYNDSALATNYFSQTAIFWFGRVSETENYADVRVAYNNSELYVYVAAFDKRLWYDTSPAANDLTAWDAVTLLVNTTGNTGSAPTTNAHRFVAQLNWFEPRANYQTAYRGNGVGWVAANTAFAAETGWRGDALNNALDDRGWVAEFRVPFAGLGVSAPPANGTVWGLGIILHDRDDAAGAPIADKTWVETLNANQPATWGQLAFGIPAYAPPPATGGGIVTVRRPTETDPSVPDATVGSATSNQCPGDAGYIWNAWGNANYGGDPDINIQNQSDVADWPCFAKYYVTFPLAAIPANKKIVTATLTLHQFGGSEPAQAQSSWIQVLTVSDSWAENTITWNNAPLARENIGGSWVAPVAFSGWPGTARTWDVSRAVVEAYASGQPVRLVLYEADAAYHSGKFFVSSNTGDWNIAGRPRLDIRWSEP